MALPRTPISSFGAQHWAMLLTVESAVVNHEPFPANVLRAHPRRRLPFHAPPWDRRVSGTVLLDGTRLPDHDDWDCLDDLEAAGLLGPAKPVHPLTDEGWRVVGMARRYVAQHRVVDGFVATWAPPVACPMTVAPPDATVRVVRDEPEHVDFEIAGLVFCCSLVGDQWRVDDLVVAARAGAPVSGKLIGRFSAEVVPAALVDHLTRRGGGVSISTDGQMRCPTCARMLFGSGPNGLTLARSSGVTGIDCGPAHLVRYHDGVSISVLDGRLELA
mgnify:CR=1 FL=1